MVSESVWRRRESGAAPANDPTQDALTEYTLQCEYSQLTGIEALLGQCDGKIINSDYQAFVLLRVALPAAKVAEFSAKLADFSRGSLQLLAIEE